MGNAADSLSTYFAPTYRIILCLTLSIQQLYFLKTRGEIVFEHVQDLKYFHSDSTKYRNYLVC